MRLRRAVVPVDLATVAVRARRTESGERRKADATGSDSEVDDDWGARGPEDR